MPPRTANSPTSRTVGTRSKPEFSSREISAFMSTWLPGLARNACASMTSAGGMRWSSALAVVRMTARCGALAQRGHRRQRVEAARGGIGAGRDAVIGQAVPGRKLEHRQVGRGEGERLDDRRQALAVARDEEQRPVGRGLGRGRGEREGLEAVGDAVDDELAGAAFRQADWIDQAHEIILQIATAAGGHDLLQQWRVESGRDRLLAGEPGQEVGVLKFEQMLILVEFGVGQGVRCAASAKPPRIRSISRMPRCQERNSSLRRRASSPSLDRAVPVIVRLSSMLSGAYSVDSGGVSLARPSAAA